MDTAAIGGVEQTIKNRTRLSDCGIIELMKILSIAWRVLVNLVEAIVILAMLYVAKTPFENIIVSALVIIYESVVTSFSMLGRALLHKASQDLARFIEIAKSLNLNTGLYEEALNEDNEEFQKGHVCFSIDSFFRAVFLLIAIANLIYAAMPTHRLEFSF
jgi:pantoate kinase